MYTGPSSSSTFTVLRCAGGAVGGVLGDCGGELIGLRNPTDIFGDGGGDDAGLCGSNPVTLVGGDGGGDDAGLCGSNPVTLVGGDGGGDDAGLCGSNPVTLVGGDKKAVSNLPTSPQSKYSRILLNISTGKPTNGLVAAIFVPIFRMISQSLVSLKVYELFLLNFRYFRF